MFGKKFFIINIIFFLFFNAISAQNCDWTDINKANIKYEDGNFDDALNIAQKCLTETKATKQQLEALRLITKTYIALDEDSAAIVTAQKIIELNPKFEPNYLSDPPQFIDIINNLKKLTQQFVVVSISKKEENIYEAPATAVVFKDKDFRQRGYLDFEAPLHDLPGFDISRSNGNLYSHIYQRGYRSINTNRTLFLIDGVEDNDLWSSNVYLSRQFIMSNVKSFEIVYGPASVMYGSNAFLGVINIITKDPTDIIQPDKQFGINAMTGYGSYNTKYADVTLAWQTKDHNVSASFSGRTFWSDEQDLTAYPEHDYAPMSLTDELTSQYHQNLDITDSAQVADFLAQHTNSSELYYFDTSAYSIILTQQGIETALDYDNDVLNKVSFSDGTQTYALNFKLKVYDFTLGWYYWQKAEGPGSQYDDTKYLGYNQGQMWRPIHHFMYLKYEKEINDKITFSNFLRFKTHYLNKNNRIVTYGKNYLSGRLSLDNLIDGHIPGWDSVYLFYKANQLRNETKIFYKPFSWLNNTTGIETRLSSIQGDYYLSFDGNAQETGSALTNIDGGNQFFSKDLGIYSQNNIHILHNLKLILALRYDFNRVRVTEGYGSVWNGRIAIVYSPKDFIFKIFNSSAFKDATNREKYSTAPGKRELPNPDLQPELVNNYEISIAKKIQNNSIVEITAYKAFYSNIIQEVQVLREDGTYTNQNQAIGKANISGINAFANFQWKNFNFYANYTYTLPYTIDPQNSDGTPYTDSLGNIITKLRISDIASHRANFGFNYNFKDISNFNIRTNYVGQRITGTNTTVPTNTSVFDPYFLLNAALNYSPKNTGLTFQISCFNLLNKEYFEPGLDQAVSPLAPMLVQNKRNFYLSLYFNF